MGGAVFGAIGTAWLGAGFADLQEHGGPVGKVWAAPVPESWPHPDDPDPWFFFGFWSRGGVLQSHTVAARPTIGASEWVGLTELRSGWPLGSMRSVHLVEVDTDGTQAYPMRDLLREGVPIGGSPVRGGSIVRGRTLPLQPVWSGVLVNGVAWGLVWIVAVEFVAHHIEHAVRQDRTRHGRCPGCGYELEGLHVCPECGKRVT